METIHVDYNRPDYEKTQQIANLIRSGKIVAVPTETVYGLAFNMDSTEATCRVREILNFPADKKFTIHVARKGDMDIYCGSLNKTAVKLSVDFMPGPITLISLDRRGIDKVGIRCPSHKVATHILEAAFFKMGMPTAKKSDGSPCLSADDVRHSYSGKIDVLVESKNPEFDSPSTVVDVSESKYQILREGAISVGKIKQSAESVRVLFVCTGNTCRSAMAHYYFANMYKSLKQENTKQVKFDSCGTLGIGGSPMSYFAKQALVDEGITGFDHSSKALTSFVARSSDIIVCMCQHHKDTVLRMGVDENTKVVTVSELFANPSLEDIPDPIGGAVAQYKNTLNQIKQASEGLIKEIDIIMNYNI